MEKDEIVKLEAGREMDELIAFEVMEYGKGIAQYDFFANGINICKGDEYLCDRDGNAYVPNYSTDMSAAWQIVEKLQAEPLEYYFEINKTPSIPFSKTGKPHWHCNFGNKFSYGDTAPVAICRAALLAVSGGV